MSQLESYNTFRRCCANYNGLSPKQKTVIPTPNITRFVPTSDLPLKIKFTFFCYDMLFQQTA